jgi:hypothetical protein
MEPNWLNPREHRAWRAFIDARHQVGVHLDRGLQESGLPMTPLDRPGQRRRRRFVAGSVATLRGRQRCNSSTTWSSSIGAPSSQDAATSLANTGHRI